jgi:hypothetical protein
VDQGRDDLRLGRAEGEPWRQAACGADDGGAVRVAQGVLLGRGAALEGDGRIAMRRRRSGAGAAAANAAGAGPGSGTAGAASAAATGSGFGSACGAAPAAKSRSLAGAGSTAPAGTLASRNQYP